MFKHILIPLDGSRLAEAAIPSAVYLGKHLHASITLIHIIELNPPPVIHGEKHLTTVEEATGYLESIKSAYFNGITTDCHIHEAAVRNIAKSIVDHGEEFDHDLIIMCSHGHGGIRKALTGSIAQKVIGSGRVPILLIQPGGGGKIASQMDKIQVALDSDVEHQCSLEAATSIAKALNAQIHLVHVIADLALLAARRAATGRVLPMSAELMHEMNELGSFDFLHNQAENTRQKGIVTTMEIREGNTAQEICAAADSSLSDVIVLGTHGKSGFDAFWKGSVTPKVVSLTHTPILLIPANWRDKPAA